MLKRQGPVELLTPEDLPDDAFVAAIGNVGAPTVSLELLPSDDEALIALEAFETQMGRKLDAVVSFEIGGGNSLIPIMAAASRGIPVVDGDGMGRALPEAQMMTYAIRAFPRPRPWPVTMPAMSPCSRPRAPTCMSAIFVHWP